MFSAKGNTMKSVWAITGTLYIFDDAAAMLIAECRITHARTHHSDQRGSESNNTIKTEAKPLFWSN